MRQVKWFWLILVLVLARVGGAAAATDLAVSSVSTNRSGVGLLSLDQLSNLNVISVSRHAESSFDAPAAVYVIRGKDIERIGATSLAEALRLAPGMNVAKVDSHTWAVSARGLNSMFSRFLEVRMDGRSVYSPMFSGVYWDTTDTLLEDVDRIEVVRGPGATMWGANAVNGVVNIMTKSAKETQGLYLEAGGGNEERAFGGMRYGGKIADDAWYRVYTKGFDRSDSVFADNSRANDGWSQERGGFRVDWEPSTINQFTFQGDLYKGNAGSTYLIATNNPATGFAYRYNDRNDEDGANLIGRWQHRNPNGHELMLQVYYDHFQRQMQTLTERHDTVDVDFQHRMPFGSRQQVTYGFGYRVAIDDFRGSPTVSFSPASRSLQLGNGFVQDEIQLVPDRLCLTAGTKLEHNDYTGWEMQPSGRLAWMPTDRQTYWGAVSRAVRMPSRADVDMRFQQEPVKPGVVPVIWGNDSFRSEEVMAYELGWRSQLHPRVTVDVATFYNVYDHVRSAEQGAVTLFPFPPTVPVTLANNLRGETYGVENVVRWQANDWWRWEAQYSFLKTHILRDAGNDGNREMNVPHHTVSVRSLVLLPGRWELTAQLRYQDGLDIYRIPGYLVCDARLAWKATKNLELAIVGQNLGNDHHAEFPSLFTVRNTEVEQSVYGKVVWRY